MDVSFRKVEVNKCIDRHSSVLYDLRE